MILGFTLAAGAAAKLVVAHDCANADNENLAEGSALRSVGEIALGLRWFYCGRLGVALAWMGTYVSDVRLQRGLK